MHGELEELKRQLQSKRFSLDEVRPLAERAARAIDRLQSENLALLIELRHYQAIEMQLKKVREKADNLLHADGGLSIEQAARQLIAILDAPVAGS